MIGKIAENLKGSLPAFLYNGLKIVYKVVFKPLNIFFFKLKIKKVQVNHDKALKIVRKKDKIKVVFFLIHESVWKYEGVYKLMEQDNRFEPVVIVCPCVTYREEQMLHEMDRAFHSFTRKGYNVIKSLNIDGSWLDVKNEILPDIVFFTNPWKLTKDIYYITNYLDTLTCYVPYFYQVTKHLEGNFGGYLQNNSWRVFYESKIHLDYAKKYSKNSASNVVISGYPALDKYLNLSCKIANNDPWKIKDKLVKRIIWAPHHTILGQDSGLGLSNFLYYADFFQRLIINNSFKIQIAFKPHPLLKSKLYMDSNWGISRTDEYYNFWENCSRGILSEGEYSNLFLTSDAMIHDSGSFTIEYLATGKPTLYLIKSSNQLESLNCLGKKAIDVHYKAQNINDIENFITSVVINGNDSKQDQRISFIEMYLVPPNNKTASQNIYNHLLSQLN